MDDLMTFNSPVIVTTDPLNAQVPSQTHTSNNSATHAPNAEQPPSPMKSIINKTFPVADLEHQLLSPFSNSHNSFSILEKLNFADLNLERESLGILNISKLDDLGRESLGILSISNSLGRESLGTFNLNDWDMGRESLGILNLNNLDLGRESLGISTLPEILISGSNSGHNSQPLDTAFLLPRNKSSISSNASCYSVNPSFNSRSLESSEPSGIFSSVSRLDSVDIGRSDIFNNALWSTSNFLQRLRSAGNVGIGEDAEHPRIQSLPEPLHPKGESHHLDATVRTMQDSLSSKENDILEDSVFIEARHVASQMADGSILDQAQTSTMLDDTAEPDDLHNILDNEPEPKCDTETIFKAVDKMLPAQNKSPVDDGQNSKEKTPSPHCSDLSEIKNNQSVQSTGAKSNHSNSKDPKDILNSLLAILSSDNLSDEQISDGQNLLMCVSSMLESRSRSKRSSKCADDSGHSSIEADGDLGADQKHECYEILDLSMQKSSRNPLKTVPKFGGDRRKTSMSTATMKRSSSLPDTASVVGLFQPGSKLKPKKFEERRTSLKKGPMKAVMPVQNIAKPRSSSVGGLTPPSRPEQKSTALRLKKTSTPISELRLKPMAQSTPESGPQTLTNRQSMNKNAAPPLELSLKGFKSKLSYSDTSLSPNQESSTQKANSLYRLQSVDDLKKLQGTPKSSLRRSASVGGVNTGSKIRQSGTKIASPLQKNMLRRSFDSGKIQKKNNKPVLGENRHSSITRPSLLKKYGKENSLV